MIVRAQAGIEPLQLDVRVRHRMATGIVDDFEPSIEVWPERKG